MWSEIMKSKLILVLVFVSIILIGVPVTSAKSSYLYSFNQRYDTADTVLDTCDVCHSGPNGGSLDSYGRAYSHTRNYGGIEDQDSDGDGFTNLEEINALTFPGDSSDHPQVEPVIVQNSTEESTEPVVNETITIPIEESSINETQENATSEIENENTTETSQTTEGDRQTPGFEVVISVFTIIAAFYFRK
jgi:hypothetical protein